MINLTPPHGKRIVRKEYLARVGSVWSLIAALAIASGALMLFPAYILVSGQIEENAAEVAVSDEAYNKAIKDLAVAGVLAERLRTPMPSVPAATVLSHMEAALETGVVVRGVSIARGEGPMTAQVVGTAATRESLRRFIERLKGDPFFKDASVPVSDLARDVDLAFTLTLTLK